MALDTLSAWPPVPAEFRAPLEDRILRGEFIPSTSLLPAHIENGRPGIPAGSTHKPELVRFAGRKHSHT